MSAPPPILCIGAMLWDVIGQSFDRMKFGADMAGSIAQFPGGVALNVAISLAGMGFRSEVISAIGRDSPGEVLTEEVERRGIGTEYLYHNDRFSTDCYIAIEDTEGLVAAIADARCLETAGARILEPLRDGRLGSARQPFSGTIILDGNMTTAIISEIATDPCFAAADIRVAPASSGKAGRVAPLFGCGNACFYLNRAEAEVLAGQPCSDSAMAAEAVLAKGAQRVLVTDGPDMVAEAIRGDRTLTAHPPRVDISRVTGAGDRFLASHFVAEKGGAGRQAALDAAVASAAAHVSGKDPA